MKALLTIISASLLSLGLVSCGGEGGDAIDTTKIVDAFKDSDGDVKATITKVVEQIGGEKFTDALSSLQGIDIAKLTGDKATLVKDLMSQVKDKVGAMAKETVEKAKGAAGDMMDKAGDATKDAAKDAGDKIEDATKGLTGDK